MSKSNDAVFFLGFFGSVIAMAAAIFVVTQYAPDQYARWSGGEQGTLVATK